ncbi:MAG: ComF family protein, partial [Gordonibacter urolithinfaciens]
MPLAVDRTRLYVRGAAEALAETLWPTRCAVCDAPGEVLCDACRSALPYLDWWRACPVCGAPFGRVQCSECNPVVLGRAGRDTVPYDGCASAVTFGEAPARIVRTYKDQGERRLAEPLACLMARARPPSWRPEAVAFVPATSAARRRRGFDHAELLARGLAQWLDLPMA